MRRCKVFKPMSMFYLSWDHLTLVPLLGPQRRQMLACTCSVGDGIWWARNNRFVSPLSFRRVVSVRLFHAIFFHACLDLLGCQYCGQSLQILYFALLYAHRMHCTCQRGCRGMWPDKRNKKGRIQRINILLRAGVGITNSKHVLTTSCGKQNRSSQPRRSWQSASGSPYWKEHRTRVIVATSEPGPVLDRAKWFGALARRGVFSAGMPIQASLPSLLFFSQTRSLVHAILMFKHETIGKLVPHSNFQSVSIAVHVRLICVFFSDVIYVHVSLSQTQCIHLTHLIHWIHSTPLTYLGISHPNL